MSNNNSIKSSNHEANDKYITTRTTMKVLLKSFVEVELIKVKLD